jgi:hypothetical protein
VVREEVFEKGEEPFRNGALNQPLREMRGMESHEWRVDEGNLV